MASKGRPASKEIPTIVVYRKTTNGKLYLDVHHGLHTDEIISTRKRNPIYPDNYILERVGMGKAFIEEWKKELGINKVNVINH